MINAKITLILNTFSRKEQSEFKKMLCSPFFNQHTKVKELGIYLLDESQKDKELDKSVVFKLLFPREPYNDAKLRHHLSYLTKLVEQFVVLKEFLNSQTSYVNVKLQAFRRRGLNKAFYKLAKQAKALPEIKSDFLFSYWIDKELFEMELSEKRMAEKAFVNVHSSLSNYFKLERLKQACLLLISRNIQNTVSEAEFIEEILESISLEHDDPVLCVYHHLFNLLKWDEEVYLQNITDLLNQYEAMFPLPELKEIYTYLINYTIKKVNQNQVLYLQRLLNLYKNAISAGVYKSENFMSPYTYKNINSVALLNQDLDWSKSFTEEYKKHLLNKDMELFYPYNLARIYFEERKFKLSLKQLRDLRTSDVFTLLDIRVLQAKCYFELENHDLLEYHTENIRQLVLRREIKTYHRKNYMNFIKYLKKLTLKKREDLFDLKTKLEQETQVAERKWLLEKVSV